MDHTGGLGGSQAAAARDLEEVPRLIAEAAAAQKDEDLRAAPSHRQQRTPRSSPQKPPRQTPNAAPHGRRRTGDAQAPGAQAPGAAETTSSEGGLTGALGQAADKLSQMLVDQEGRAPTSEGRLRAEDAEARDHDRDHSIEEAPPAEAAPAAAPAAASAWCEDDRLVLQALRNGGKKHGLSLGRLRKAAERHGLTISGKSNFVPLKKALEEAEPAASSSDDDDRIVPGMRVLTELHGAGTVLEGHAGNGRPRVRLDVPRKNRRGFYESEVAIAAGHLTVLASGDAHYEAQSTTGAVGSGATAPNAAGSGAGAAFALKVERVLNRPTEHELGFDAPEEVVPRREAPRLVVPRPLLAIQEDPDEALGRAAEDSRRALREHKSLLGSLKERLNQKEAEAEDFGRREHERKEEHVKEAREAYAAEAAKSQRLTDAFAEASRALDAATVSFCPELDALIKSAVDPLRADEEEQAALRRRVAVQLEHSESEDAKKLGLLRPARGGHALWDVAEHDGTPPFGVIAVQCPRENCQARYWFPFKKIHDDVMRDNNKILICKGCGFAQAITRGDFGDRRAHEGDMDDELARWGVDYA